MKINLAKSAGFCFGVRRALTITFQTAASKNKVYMLGDIVHNDTVVNQIKKLGIKKIIGLKSQKGKTLIIRAHGAPSATIKKANQLGYRIIDATCPMVKEIHKIALKMEKEDYKLIVIGDKKHDEVRGIVGQLKSKAIVIDNLKTIPWKTISKLKKTALVVQSTQNIDNVLKIVKVLKKQIKNLKFFNTVCNPTRAKQKEIKTMPQGNDLMLIVGSKASANTKRLYEISKSLNKRSFWIQSEKDLKPNWFKNVRKVGLTAGASTPDSTTKKIIRKIRLFSAAKPHKPKQHKPKSH
jgi:4-hydroxy-3-methylbut-2-enyl diphosphate reductase